MAGSPRYLALLQELYMQPHIEVDWEAFDYHWHLVEGFPSSFHLRQFAWTAFHLLATLRSQTVSQTAEEARALHIAKNAGYAGADNPDPWANFRLCEAFGIPAEVGVLVRLTDKISRIRALRRDPNNERVGESLADSVADAAAYALIGDCLTEERKAQE